MPKMIYEPEGGYIHLEAVEKPFKIGFRFGICEAEVETKNTSRVYQNIDCPKCQKLWKRGFKIRRIYQNWLQDAEPVPRPIFNQDFIFI